MRAEFDLQPCLEGARARIRPLRPTDFDALFAVTSDALLWAQHPIRNRHERPGFTRLFEDSLASKGALVVIDKITDRLIGSSRYRMADPTANRAEIGWSWLARSHWGGTWNREVKLMLLSHAFRFVDMVVFRVGQDNARSRRAMEKIGGRLTDRTETIQGPDGAPIVHVVFEISKADLTP